ncbi:MAG: hypothetical protein RBR35_11340 [Salinivirgaceae bacterium]|nr:hypothetical protein [Salinivirgaceae bacterium]
MKRKTGFAPGFDMPSNIIPDTINVEPIAPIFILFVKSIFIKKQTSSKKAHMATINIHDASIDVSNMN